MTAENARSRDARFRAILGLIGVPALVAIGLLAAAPAAGGSRRFVVRSYGAVGNGRHNDSPAINRAIAAANRARGGVVELPRGRYLAGGSIHMLSNVTLRLDAGATLLGAKSGYDLPEPNPYSRYQGAGHSHFHDAMIWGENVHNIGFVGSGVIDGGGNLFTGNLIRGHADKIISLVRCDGLTISGITLERGGHFAILINDCWDVRSNDLTILTAGDRDGWNVISSQDVRITNLIDHAYDDALAFKSDWALGATLPSGNVTVTNAHLSSVCCNAVMFGSETCGNFTNYRLSHIVITRAGKSGLGMVSMDGGHISDVDYSDVAMSGVAGPIMEKVGIRRSCGGNPAVGDISNIHYQEITATSLNRYTPTLWGASGHQIRNITFDHVDFAFSGRHVAVSPAVPGNNPYLYNPDSIGPRPSYGFYLHDVDGVTFNDSAFGLKSPDGRPPFVINDARGVVLDHVTAARGTRTRADVVLQAVASYRVTDSRSSGGNPLRVSGI